MTPTKAREKFDYSFKANGVFNLKIEDIDTDKRIIKAVANAYNYLDSQLDVLMPGCATKSIKEMGPESKENPKIKHALFHDLTRLPGKIIKLEEKEVTIRGENTMCLCFESELDKSQDGNETLMKYLNGTYDQHSIGFNYVKVKEFFPISEQDSDEAKEWREFKKTIINGDQYEELAEQSWGLPRVLRVDEIKLMEISTVAFGANSATPYLGTKSINAVKLNIFFEDKLDALLRFEKKNANMNPQDRAYNISCMVAQLKSITQQIFCTKELDPYINLRFKAAEEITIETPKKEVKHALEGLKIKL